MQSLIIRKATQEDTDELEILFQITRQDTFKSFLPEQFKIGDYKISTEGEEVWVAEENGRIVGFISFWIPDNFIHNLFVYPNKQGCGIGKKLLKIAESRLVCPIELKVTLDNHNAKLFYQNQGWKEVSTHKNESESYILFRKDSN